MCIIDRLEDVDRPVPRRAAGDPELLQAASTLRASYLRIRSTAREESEELVWARNELKATLAALEADLEDLEESVKIVENTGARMFGLEEAEVMERRRYVGFVRKEIDVRSL